MNRIASPYEAEERQKAQKEYRDALRQDQEKKGWSWWQKAVVWVLIIVIIRLVMIIFFGFGGS